MAFPSGPTVGQTYTTPGGRTYTYLSSGVWQNTTSSGTALPTNATGELYNNGSGTLSWASKTWTTAGRPSSPFTGQAGFNSSLGYSEVWTGAAWVRTIGSATWTTAGRPTSPYTGQTGFNSTLNYPEIWNGTSWAPFTNGTSSSASRVYWAL